MKVLLAILALASLSSFAYADDMGAFWSSLQPAAAEAAAAAAQQYPVCDSNGPSTCPQDYICWGTNVCLPHYCHMGCAYNSPCWPDGTCNYGE